VESFAYSAWKPLTWAMIRDIRRESGNWRKWQREQYVLPLYSGGSEGLVLMDIDCRYAYPSSKDIDLLDKFRKAKPTDVSTDRDNYAWSPDGKPYWHLKEGRFLTSSEMGKYKCTPLLQFRRLLTQVQKHLLCLRKSEDRIQLVIGLKTMPGHMEGLIITCTRRDT